VSVERDLGRAAAAQVFEQKDHLVLAILPGVRRPPSGATAALELGDVLRKFPARVRLAMMGFQDARAEKLGYILQLIGGKTLEETARGTFPGIVDTGTQRVKQGSSHSTTPAGRKP
jgi:hypothetical protein